MAEFVQFRMERALAEYEQMRTLKLFSDEEILSIKKTRENFEYRVTQPSRSLKDFLEYINYDRKLIKLTKERVLLNKITTNNTIVPMIASRIKQIFSQAISKFSHNTRLWDEYVKFLHQLNFHSDIPNAFQQMLQYHSDKEDVWIRAILWEFNDGSNYERLKGILIRAQRKHPKSKRLLCMFFQIELENKQNAAEDIVLQLAQAVYVIGKKHFKNDISFFVDMLKAVDKFPYASSLQETILNDMQNEFANDEFLWHTLAQRELNGINPSDTLKKRIQSCTQIYDEAVEKINTTKMWTFYVDSMIELNSDLSTQASCKRAALGKAFFAANNSNKMSEKHYLAYVELLYAANPKNENIINVFKNAISLYKNSLDIWYAFLNFYIYENDIENARKTFKAADRELGRNGAEIWLLYLDYVNQIQTKSSNDEFKSLVQEVAGKPYQEFNELRASVLEMVAISSGIKCARKYYELFNKYKLAHELFAMMADLEAKQPKRDLDLERKCLEKYTICFGETRPDAWLRYMRYERSVGDPMNVSRLYTRAVNTLKTELLDEFTSLYNSFKVETVLN